MSVEDKSSAYSKRLSNVGFLADSSCLSSLPISTLYLSISFSDWDFSASILAILAWYCFLLMMPLLLLSFFFFLSLPLQWAHLACVSQLLSWLLSSATLLLNHGLRWMSSLPGAAVDDVSFNQKQVWLYYFVLICLLSAWMYEKRIKRSKNC